MSGEEIPSVAWRPSSVAHVGTTTASLFDVKVECSLCSAGLCPPPSQRSVRWWWERGLRLPYTWVGSWGWDGYRAAVESRTHLKGWGKRKLADHRKGRKRRGGFCVVFKERESVKWEERVSWEALTSSTSRGERCTDQQTGFHFEVGPCNPGNLSFNHPGSQLEDRGLCRQKISKDKDCIWVKRLWTLCLHIVNSGVLQTFLSQVLKECEITGMIFTLQHVFPNFVSIGAPVPSRSWCK